MINEFMDIFIACKNGSYEEVVAFIESDEEVVNVEQNLDAHVTGLCGTPIMFAVRFDQLEIAELLIRCGANVDKRRDNRGCISIAIEENSVRMIKLLLEANTTVCESDFLRALSMKRWEIATLLLSKPINLFHVGPTGSTALHLVVSGNMLSLAEDIMIKAPRLVTIKNASGKIPLTIAMENQFRDMILLIKKYSANYNLENFKSTSIQKYEECTSALLTAEEVFNEQNTVVEQLKTQIEETRNQLKTFLAQFEAAQKKLDQAKESYEEEIENINKKIGLKPYSNLLECPVCLDIPFHPKLVYQCDDGHILCSECRDKLSLCPECRCNLKENMARNRRVESLIEQMYKPTQ